MSKCASESNLEGPRDKEELNAEEGNGLNEYQSFRAKALESKQTQDDEITSLEEQDDAVYTAATPPQIFFDDTNGSDDASTGQEKDYEMKELEGTEGMQEQTEENIANQEASRESGPHSEEDTSVVAEEEDKRKKHSRNTQKKHNRVNPEKSDANSNNSTSNNDIDNEVKSKSDENAELYQPPRKMQQKARRRSKKGLEHKGVESIDSSLEQQSNLGSFSKSPEELIQKIDLYCKKLGCHHIPTIVEKAVFTRTPLYGCRFCPGVFVGLNTLCEHILECKKFQEYGKICKQLIKKEQENNSKEIITDQKIDEKGNVQDINDRPKTKFVCPLCGKVFNKIYLLCHHATRCKLPCFSDFIDEKEISFFIPPSRQTSTQFLAEQYALLKKIEKKLITYYIKKLRQSKKSRDKRENFSKKRNIPNKLAMIRKNQ